MIEIDPSLSSRAWVLQWCSQQEAKLGGQANVCDEIRAALGEADGEIKRLRDALRIRVIKDGAVINGRVFRSWCVQCSTSWEPGASERHSKECIAQVLP